MNKRLEQFLVAENITQSQLADKLGVARAGVSHVLAGRNKPGYEFIYNLTTNFPDLNLDWLITGKGKMYRSLMNTHPQIQQTQEPAELPPRTLFEFDEETSSESNIPVQMPTPSGNIEITDIPQQVVNVIQTPVKQRVVTKIVVFFDDNTFQEL